MVPVASEGSLGVPRGLAEGRPFVAAGVKIILSRKGFDSSAGGCASPIMPDGTLVALPIPDRLSPIHYEDVSVAGYSVARIVADLTHQKQKPHYGAHLDPDLMPDAYPRTQGWRAVFGQAGGAQAQLEREGVGCGDLFLFFGWFRKAEEHAGVFRFVKSAPDLHVLWGWLQVDIVLPVATSRIPPWAVYHPHVASAAHRGSRNTLYVARERLVMDGVTTQVPGAGVFAAYDDRLRLTKPGAKRSLWSLPASLRPVDDRPPLSYHHDPARWAVDGDRVDLQSAKRGQEFVIDTRRYPESLGWARHLLGG